MHVFTIRLMCRLLLTAVLAASITVAGVASGASVRVINTSQPRSYSTGPCPSGTGKCVVVPGRQTSAFSLSAKPTAGNRNLHAVIYAGICDAQTPVQRIARVEERRHTKSVDLLVVLSKLPKPDPSAPPVMCPALARAYPFTIRLSAALGKRVVRDASTVPPHHVATVPS